MKRIFKYEGREGPIITEILMLRYKTMIDEDEYDITYNGIGNSDNSFKPEPFGGTFQVDVNLSQNED